MLRVTVELLPYGSETNKRVLADAIIFNDGTSTNVDVGNYRAEFTETWQNGFRQRHRLSLRGHDRRQSVWVLIGGFLDQFI